MIFDEFWNRVGWILLIVLSRLFWMVFVMFICNCRCIFWFCLRCLWLIMMVLVKFLMVCVCVCRICSNWCWLVLVKLRLVFVIVFIWLLVCLVWWVLLFCWLVLLLFIVLFGVLVCWLKFWCGWWIGLVKVILMWFCWWLMLLRLVSWFGVLVWWLRFCGSIVRLVLKRCFLVSGVCRWYLIVLMMVWWFLIIRDVLNMLIWLWFVSCLFLMIFMVSGLMKYLVMLMFRRWWKRFCLVKFRMRWCLIWWWMLLVSCVCWFGCCIWLFILVGIVLVWCWWFVMWLSSVFLNGFVVNLFCVFFMNCVCWWLVCRWFLVCFVNVWIFLWSYGKWIWFRWWMKRCCGWFCWLMICWIFCVIRLVCRSLNWFFVILLICLFRCSSVLFLRVRFVGFCCNWSWVMSCCVCSLIVCRLSGWLIICWKMFCVIVVKVGRFICRFGVRVIGCWLWWKIMVKVFFLVSKDGFLSFLFRLDVRRVVLVLVWCCVRKLFSCMVGVLWCVCNWVRVCVFICCCWCDWGCFW